MKDILLSVIVTIYNLDQYLEICLNSIIRQTYKNLDIILIDDGSTDSSGLICDEYGRQDKRVRVFHRENRGLVESRKYGIQKAKGNYLTFVDGDDWIESVMYEQMLEGVKGRVPDIISSGITYQWTDHIDYEVDLLPEKYYEKEEIKEKIIPVMMHDKRYRRRAVTGAVWNKIFSKSLLEQFVYSINPKLTFGEDAVITYPAIARADNFRVITKSWYHYRQHKESMMHMCDMRSFQYIKLLKDDLEKNFFEINLEKRMKEQITFYLQEFLSASIWKIYSLSMNLEDLPYFFPYEMVQAKSKIILYGAGNVGTSYRNCLNNGNYVSITAWVDQDYRRYWSIGKKEVEAPGIIMEREYDFILIAVESENVANSIKEWLIDQGINSDKILYSKPKRTRYQF